MKIKTVLMDVDGTMTVYPQGTIMNQSPKTLLEDLMMDSFSISREEAWKRVLACGDVETHCLTEFFPQLKVDGKRYFELLLADLKKTTIVPEDTIRLFRHLKERGIPLYTATTNSRFITLAKLAVCEGLASYEGCEYITGYFPGCAFRDPEGKYSASYYSNILKAGPFEGEYTLMIGDEPIRDGLPARRSGIRYAVNIDRKAEAPSGWDPDGILHIRSYDELIPLLEKA